MSITASLAAQSVKGRTAIDYRNHSDMVVIVVLNVRPPSMGVVHGQSLEMES